LFRGVDRNIKINFDFYCLSNTKTKYNTIPLVTDSDGYWNKIELFRPNLFVGPTLYLDLDVVVCNDITDLVNQVTPDRLLMVEEPYRSIHNSSVMLWNNDYSDLYFNYINNQQEVIRDYTNVDRDGALGDQAYISENIKHETFDQKYIGWKHHKIVTEIKDPSLVIFTGRKKPHLETDTDIIRENWV
jgi:hypothetical protein